MRMGAVCVLFADTFRSSCRQPVLTEPCFPRDWWMPIESLVSDFHTEVTAAIRPRRTFRRKQSHNSVLMLVFSAVACEVPLHS